jgi:hypothetical protein
MSNFNLADVDKSQFTDDISKLCFALINCRAELLNEGNGFSVISIEGPVSISNIEWEGAGPTVELTDAEVQAKVAELFP